MASKTVRVRPRFLAALLLLAALGLACYGIWSPGRRVRDGRHDRRANGIWLQHGWLGDDTWFERYGRDKAKFRNDQRIAELKSLLDEHGITYVFPHLCPSDPDGSIAPVDPEQTERFLDGMGPIQVIPWVGGVLGVHCYPESPAWRRRFVASVVELLEAHPRLAGVQVNIEPMPSGNPDYLLLLDELGKALSEWGIVSVAAYPPPTRWHPFADVHWDEPYFRAVAERCGLLAPMMYDTALRIPKVYEDLMAEWTRQVLDWAGSTTVLLGVPAYDDADTGYHDPRVENLDHAIAGIHAGLAGFEALPPNYQGLAIYCEWEMESAEWDLLRREFELLRQPVNSSAPPPPATPPPPPPPATPTPPATPPPPRSAADAHP